MRKLDAGADFILTQPVFCASSSTKFLEYFEKENGPIPIPMLVGILPLASHRHANFLHHEVPGIEIPEDIRKKMEAAGDDGARTGIQIAIELIQEVKSFSKGIYLMPAFNRFDYVAEIIEAVKG